MNCPHCASTSTKEQTKQTSLGYRTFRCSACKRTFNERTGTPFNYLEYPTDIVLLVVLWRLRYKLSLRDLAEMFLERGFEFTHEAVRDLEARFAPLIADQLRAKRLDALPGHSSDSLAHRSMQGEQDRAHLIGSCVLNSDTSTSP